ncbi:hypothetical protein TNIN_332951 [Trichonephila inaurata madagascariensis]|uniref:Uncharacterized protein n=1 Tax=Trichonephila inaurata madagascariensis TaxID=2747483 RepID=A0A8X7CET6_9ARAC|nr:hypothetical protein TNIN_332951 [Trichonephila inaurata madagascariensis]
MLVIPHPPTPNFWKAEQWVLRQISSMNAKSSIACKFPEYVTHSACLVLYRSKTLLYTFRAENMPELWLQVEAM